MPAIDFAVCAEDDRPIRSSMGFTIQAEHGLDRLAQADLIGVPAIKEVDASPAVIEAIRAAYDRGARLMSVCSGSFILGQAGLLDGRECTTHWMHTERMQRMFPAAKVVPEVLYVDAGQVVTSAGSAAGMDAALHIWRQEHGAAIANIVARRAVVPPYRDGGQAQFIARAVPDCDADTLAPLLRWVVENLAEDHGVEALAQRALMSPRTFARRFRDETGTTPHTWITRQRVAAAEEPARAHRPPGRADRRRGRLRQRRDPAPPLRPGARGEPAEPTAASSPAEHAQRARGAWLPRCSSCSTSAPRSRSRSRPCTARAIRWLAAKRSRWRSRNHQ
ncbi:DJ-1/PfpI family protein [Nocardioides convexus]|uniref:DJ-1/PfpI family protein n=1 Tax=Nocardioides convexus TaxID=2712224 RepID=UPI0024188276|nr:DJ-1/PfpI family protein [Nocardioides convexus]